MKAVELIAVLEAEEKLFQRGYVKDACSSCGGIGWTKVDGYTIQQAKALCIVCDGEGYIWSLRPLEQDE